MDVRVGYSLPEPIMWKIIAAYMAVAGLCLAFLDTLGPAKDVIVIAAFIATAIAVWKYEPDRREMKESS